MIHVFRGFIIQITLKRYNTGLFYECKWYIDMPILGLGLHYGSVPLLGS